MTRRRWFDLGLVALVAILYFSGGFKWIQAQLLGLLASSPEMEEEPIGQLAAEDWNWRLRDLEGNFVVLDSFRGKPLIVNRWATWCGPCQAEMPFLESLHQRYGENISMLLISDEEPDILQNWLQKKEYSAPVYRMTESAPAAFRTRSIPATWLVDPKGQIWSKHQGAARWNSSKVEEAIDAMLDGGIGS